MTKIERIRRFGLKVLLGQGALRRLDDAQAIEAMQEAHRAYQRVKRHEADKEASETALTAAAADVMRQLRTYGELHTNDAPDPDDYRRWIL